MASRVVIIPVYNQLEYVQRSILSVIAKTPELKLIVVDDASPDNATADWLRENEKPLGFHLIRHDKSCNFSKSANDGIDYAMNNYEFNCLCVLNSDTEIVTEDWFEQIERKILTDEAVGVAGVVSNNAGIQSVVKDKYLKRIHSKPTVKSIIVHGFCLFLSSKLLQVVGRYDHETFPSYLSDADFCMASLKSGFYNVVVGSVYVHHYGQISGIKDNKKDPQDAFEAKWGVAYTKARGPIIKWPIY